MAFRRDGARGRAGAGLSGAVSGVLPPRKLAMMSPTIFHARKTADGPPSSMLCDPAHRRFAAGELERRGCGVQRGGDNAPTPGLPFRARRVGLEARRQPAATSAVGTAMSSRRRHLFFFLFFSNVSRVSADNGCHGIESRGRRAKAPRNMQIRIIRSRDRALPPWRGAGFFFTRGRGTGRSRGTRRPRCGATPQGGTIARARLTHSRREGTTRLRNVAGVRPQR